MFNVHFKEVINQQFDICRLIMKEDYIVQVQLLGLVFAYTDKIPTKFL